MNWITEDLAVGDVDDCSWMKRAGLQQEGIDVILDIRHLFLQPHNPDVMDSLEDCVPIFPKMWRFIRLMNDLARMKWKIMIHCHGGIDRAPFVATLFVWMNKCVPIEEAYAMVAERRPQIIEHWDWVKLAKESLEHG